jgi:hypothetical protein
VKELADAYVQPRALISKKNKNKVQRLELPWLHHPSRDSERLKASLYISPRP